MDFVSLANNHSLDYREAGLAETQRVLRAAGIAHAGAGRAGEAAAPVILERAGLRLAFLSYSGALEGGDHAPQCGVRGGVGWGRPGAG